MKTAPPPELAGRRATTEETTGRWADQGLRSCRYHSSTQRQLTASQLPRQDIPLAPTAPGLSTARLRAVNTACWCRQERRFTQPTQGTPVARTDMGRQGTGKKPCSARSPHAEITESVTRQGDPPNGRAHLMCAATKWGKEGGDPPPSSTHPCRTARDRGRTPEQGSGGPHLAARTRRRKGPFRPSTARNPRAGRRGGGHLKQAMHSPGTEEGGDLPKRQRALPVHGVPYREGGRALTPGGRGRGTP